MKSLGYFFILFFILFTFSVPAQEKFIDSMIVPLGYGTTAGNGIFVGPLANTDRTYQLLINENQLTSLAGLDLIGISFRLPVAATTVWPDSDIVFASYDIYLSGSVRPVDRSLTFANNVVGTQTKVRSGPLEISGGTYQFGGSPNIFGKEITFDTTWLYTGGHLLIEIRHLGSAGTSRSIDAITTSNPLYASEVSAAWIGDYAGTVGLQGNFGVIRISATDPVPVELTSFSAIAYRNTVELIWATATESNNYGFEVERLSDNKWIKIGFVQGAGTTTEPTSYSFMDKNLNSGKYVYRLRQMDFDGISSYSDQTEAEISVTPDYSLQQNYPNPFNPVTTLEFSIKEKSNVRLTVYNSLGEEVALLLNETKESGYYKIPFDASNLMSGVYYYEIKADGYTDVKKMILLK